MKKLMAATMALIMCLTMTTVALSAQETTTTSLTFELKNEPTYTVSIPKEITITKAGSQLDIVASDVANLDNHKVSVTIAGTDQFWNQMTMQGKTSTGSNASIRYQFVKQDGTIIETTGTKNQVCGVEIASFTDNGTESLTVLPVLNGSSSIKTGVTYTGSITYGIELVSNG